jgi:hypothetical protein
VAVVAGGALQTDLDKAQFGLVAGQFVFFPITMMVKGIGSIAQDNEALKSAAIGLSVLTAAIDMGAAAIDAAQGAGA